MRGVDTGYWYIGLAVGYSEKERQWLLMKGLSQAQATFNSRAMALDCFEQALMETEIDSIISSRRSHA